MAKVVLPGPARPTDCFLKERNLPGVVEIILPVFAIVALGYLAVRLRLYPQSGVKGLIAFVNSFATPFLLFRAMLATDFKTTFSPAIIGPYFIGALLVFVLGIFAGRKLFAKRPGEAVVSGFSAMFTNTVLLGIPVLQRAFGEEAMPIVFSIVGVHAAILLTAGMLVMELFRHDSTPFGPALLAAGKSIVSNPLLIGIALGLVGNLSGISLPETIDAFTLLMTQAVVPVALFGLGGALNAYRLADNWQQGLVLSMLKTLVHPFLVWLIMVPVLGVETGIARYAIVLAAMPTGINAYIFATYYARAQDLAANTVLISTVLSVFSVSMWLFVLGA